MAPSRDRSPADALRHKNGFRRRLARGVLLVALALGISATAVVLIVDWDRILTNVVQKQLQKRLANDVRIERVHWSRPFDLSAHRLVIARHSDGQSLFAIETADIHLRPIDYLRGRGLGVGIDIFGTQLALLRTDAGLTLPALEMRADKTTKAAPKGHLGEEEKSLEEVLKSVPKIHLLPSTLQISAVRLLPDANDVRERGPIELAEAIELRALGRSDGAGRLSASLEGKLPETSLQVRLALGGAHDAQSAGKLIVDGKLALTNEAVTHAHAIAAALKVPGFAASAASVHTPAASGTLKFGFRAQTTLPPSPGALPRALSAKLSATAEAFLGFPRLDGEVELAREDGDFVVRSAEVATSKTKIVGDGSFSYKTLSPSRLTGVVHALQLKEDAHSLRAAVLQLQRRTSLRGELPHPALSKALSRVVSSMDAALPRLPRTLDAVATLRPNHSRDCQQLDAAVFGSEPGLMLELHAVSSAPSARTIGEHELRGRARAVLDRPERMLVKQVPLGARKLRIAFAAFGRPTHLFGSGEVRLDDLFVAKGGFQHRLGHLILPISLRPDALEVRNIKLDDSTANLNGELLVAPPARGAWQKANLAGELHLRGVGAAAKALGNLRLDADIIVGGAVTKPLIETRLGAHLGLFDAHTRATTDPSEASNAVADAGVKQGDGGIYITALGNFAADKASIRALSIRPDAGGHLSAKADIDLKTQVLSISAQAHDFALRSNDARLAFGLAAAGSLKDRVGIVAELATKRSALKIDGQLHLDETPIALALVGKIDARDLDAYLPPQRRLGMTGLVKLKGTLGGAFAAPSAHLAMTLEDFALKRAQLGRGKVNAEASLTDGAAIRINVADEGSVRAQLVADKHNDAWQMAASLDELKAEAWLPSLRGTAAALQLAGTAKVLWGDTPAERHAEISLTRLHIAARDEALDLTQPTTLRWQPDSLSLCAMRLDGSAGHLVARADVGNQLPTVSAQGQLELALLAPFVPALAEAQGRLAIDAELKEPNKQLAASGSVRVLTPLWVRPRGSPTEVRIERGDVRFGPSQVTIHVLDGSLEGGSFHVAGEVGMRAFVPTHWALDVRGAGLPLHGSDLLLETNLKLALRGTGQAPTLSGEVEIVGGRYLKQVRLRDFHFVSREVNTQSPLALRAPYLGNVGLDVRAKSPAGVEIAVDAGAFAANTTLVADVRITGNLLAPKLAGKIQASEGRLHFPRGDLQLSSAQIDFEPARRSRSEPLGAELTLLAEGEVHASGAGSSTAYLVNLHLDGTPKSLALDLSCDQGLSQLEVLSLLTTGHVNVSDLASGDQDQSKLDAALALAGSQLSQPVTRFAEDKLEQALDLQLELGVELAGGNMRLTAAKNVTRRLRLESAYSHALAQEQSNVAGRALLSLTDRLLLEGVTARDLTGPSTSASQGPSMQSNLELKYRVVGN